MGRLNSLSKGCLRFAFCAIIATSPFFAMQATVAAQQVGFGSAEELKDQQEDSLKVDLLDGGAIHVSGGAFNFPRTFVGRSFTRTVTTVTNNSSRTITLQPSISGDDSFSLPGGGCSSTLVPGKRCQIFVQFLPMTPNLSDHSAVLNFGISTPALGHSQTVKLRGLSVNLPPGDVTQTANPQVAKYTMTLPAGATWSVAFGSTASYGFSTSAQHVEDAGVRSMYVAGMLPNTIYHMQASIILRDGSKTVDVDHTFTTGALPQGIPTTFPATTTSGMTPQPGVELINPVLTPFPMVLASDLQGNVIWTYSIPKTGTSALYPVRQLPNGNFLCMIAPIYPALPTSVDLNVIREFDLAGNTVQEISMTDLNARLAAKGFAVKLSAFSHDILLLPNGHYLVLAGLLKDFTSLTGYPSGVTVAGDAVVDLDRNLQPTWVWNSFDHLDINRHPMAFPDWTHANSLSYSTDDGNFLISLRHQNWVLKIDYRNGKGTGNTIWHLGEGGDFALQNGTDPTDWFYAQHYANFTSANTTGVFKLTLFDNGNDRAFPAGFICGPLPGQTPCQYSTVQELKIDEHAMTATFLFHDTLPTYLTSAFAGNAELLPNQNFEFNSAGTTTGAYVLEVAPGPTLTSPPQTVWDMDMHVFSTYRAYRQPSLYPGVQW